MFVSFSQKSGSGVPLAESRRVPRLACSATIVWASRPSDGFAGLRPHDHVLRNQSVGRTSIVAASGPAFLTVTRTSMSSGEAFAYSAVISQ